MITAELISLDGDTIYFGEFRIEDDTDTWDVYLEDEYRDFFYSLESAIRYCMEQNNANP